jgi:type IX secretion system PorP/SprF family membrane protein
LKPFCTLLRTFKTYIFLILIAKTCFSFGQIPVFSQYSHFHTFTNPSAVALKNENSATFLFRNQSIGIGEPFYTPAVEVSLPFIHHSQQRRIGGLGVGITNETAGKGGFLNTSSISTHLAYNLEFDDHWKMAFGLQGSYFFRTWNTQKITTESQYLIDGYNPNASIEENLSNLKTGFPLISAGTTFYYENNENGDNHIPLRIGFTGFGLNQPLVSETTPKSKIPITLVATFELEAYYTNIYSIVPMFRVVSQEAIQQYRLGNHFRYFLDRKRIQRSKTFSKNILKEGFVAANVAVQFPFAMMVGFELEQPQYSFGVSYDFAPATEIPVKQIRNAFEIHIAWRQPFELLKKRKKIIDKTNNPNNTKDTTKNSDSQAQTDLEKQAGEGNKVEKSRGITVITREPLEIIAPRQKIKISEAEKAIFLKKITYIFDEYELTSLQQLQLNDFVRILQKYPEITLKIIGNHEAKEAEILAFTRAEQVRNYLALQGIDEKRLILQKKYFIKNQNAKEVTFILLRK